MHTLSLQNLYLGLKNKTFSSVELTQHFLQRIYALNALNTFISLDEEHALKRAAEADKCIAQNKQGPLTGIPLAHKDNFCTTRMPTTCGSRMLEHFIAPYQATLVTRLEKAGGILLGKANMDEFAMGSSNETSYFGAVKNPWDLHRVPGGSSGGSAAAVAAGLVPFATGSDTGGSIRQPAAFCGVSGLKPTYGLVSRYGMVAYASSMDQAGPIAKSAEDIATILEIMAGFDPNDSTSSSHPVPRYSAQLTAPLCPLRIGVPSYIHHASIDSSIKKAVNNALRFFEAQGAIITEIELPLHTLWIPCYYVLACAEASSNLARFDGIRYGYRTTQADSLRTLISQSRAEGFGQEVKRRILTGTHILSSDCFDSYYVHAQRVRRLMRDELINVLQEVDILLSPTTSTPAVPFNTPSANPDTHYSADAFTVGANLAGLPAIAFPAGQCDKTQLPLSIQLMGNYFEDGRLLSIAHHFQQATHWHRLQPTQVTT